MEKLTMTSRGAYGKGFQRGFEAGKTKGYDLGRSSKASAVLFSIVGSVIVTAVSSIFLGKKKK